MSDYLKIPDGYTAICNTVPAAMDSSWVPKLMAQIKEISLPDLKADRMLYANQITRVDSAAVAALMFMAEVAHGHGKEFLVCDPPPIMRSFLEVYGRLDLIEGRVLVAFADGRYESDRIGFVPPFVPDPAGRIDIYEDGVARSYRYGERHIEEIDPVDLSTHPAKASPAVSAMAVTGAAGERKAMEAKAYVHLRRYHCSCSVTHSTFEKLHNLQQWAKAKGFDFVDMELLAGEQPPGTITYRTQYRDKQHYDQYQILLKIDTSWQEIVEGVGAYEDEFHYVY